MTKDELKQKTKDEILLFIQDRLCIKSLDNQKIREEKIRESASSNLNILNKFADLGIYENTSYLILDNKILHLQYYGKSEEEKLDLSSLSTIEIIYTILKKTILMEKKAS